MKTADNGTVAIVNGHEITSTDLKGQVKFMSTNSFREQLRKLSVSTDPKVAGKLKLELLSRMIDEFLVMEYGVKEYRIKINEREVNKQFKELFSTFPGGFTYYVSLYGDINIDSFKDKIRRDLMVKKTLEKYTSGISVTEKEVEDYYKKNRKNFFRPEMVKLRQIVTSSLEEAKSILLQLKKHRGDVAFFGRLARRYSISPEGKNGGDLGYLTEKEVPEEFSICFRLRKGEISNIVNSPYGYHIFLIEDRRPQGYMKLQDVREEIVRTLMERKKRQSINRLIRDLRKSAEIIIYENKLAKVQVF